MNGELLYDSEDCSFAFQDIDTSDGMMPAISLAGGERAQVNFGCSREELQFYSYLEGLGYMSLCSHSTLQYNIPLWYSFHGGFQMLDDPPGRNPNCKFDTKRRSSGFAVTCRDWDYSMQSDQDCLRLNIGCTVRGGDEESVSSPLMTLLPRPGLLSPSPCLDVEGSVSFTDMLAQKPPLLGAPLSFSVEFSAGQVPCLAFVGWTTPSFRYVESQFTSREDADHHSHGGSSYGQLIEMVGGGGTLPSHDAAGAGAGAGESSTSFHTAFMVCLCDLLPSYITQLTAPVR